MVIDITLLTNLSFAPVKTVWGVYFRFRFTSAISKRHTSRNISVLEIFAGYVDWAFRSTEYFIMYHFQKHITLFLPFIQPSTLRFRTIFAARIATWTARSVPRPIHVIVNVFWGFQSAISNRLIMILFLIYLFLLLCLPFSHASSSDRFIWNNRRSEMSIIGIQKLTKSQMMTIWSFVLFWTLHRDAQQQEGCKN